MLNLLREILAGTSKNRIERVSVRRHPENPLITADSSRTLGDNINGPSVIRVPAWVENPLGSYYMYFAHHGGSYIRMAHADSPGGPWTVHEPGTLRLEDVSILRGHIASPDVHVDEERRMIRMYFHGLAADREGQWSGVGLSSDGLRFEPSDEILGQFYFRAWSWKGAWYALAKDGNTGWGELYRSADGLTGFESRGRFLRRVRHCAVIVRGHHLLVFYSRKGDAPERIVAATVDLRPPWQAWKPSKAIEVLRPEAGYEGIAYPNRPSRYGKATEVNQLRDPYVYEEGGRSWLFYTIAGEMGIAVAELDMEFRPASPPRSRLVHRLVSGGRR